ncbi:Uncharacterized protein OBRU01_12276 [Operophtera brumata]|uniref:Uncharacterized protein n=1 Tax=Operophtera brumata TaxID=104452 RepID=A0A0L7LBK3_OPEBR|nr:Uncharacterized protein OBRU01_12276 [Operophtera brumata]
MDVDGATNLREKLLECITVVNHITSIIFSLHNVARQKTKSKAISNMVAKRADTSFKVRYKSQDYPLPTEKLTATWATVTKANSLNYKDFGQGDNENWYGKMGPYLDMYSAFALRVKELRLGQKICL